MSRLKLNGVPIPDESMGYAARHQTDWFEFSQQVGNSCGLPRSDWVQGGGTLPMRVDALQIDHLLPFPNSALVDWNAVLSRR